LNFDFVDCSEEGIKFLHGGWRKEVFGLIELPLYCSSGFWQRLGSRQNAWR